MSCGQGARPGTCAAVPASEADRGTDDAARLSPRAALGMLVLIVGSTAFTGSPLARGIAVALALLTAVADFL